MSCVLREFQTTTQTMKTIKVRDSQIDNYTPVVALDVDGGLMIDHYGSFQCGPYLRCDEIMAVLNSYEPRSDKDRVDFVAKHNHDIGKYHGEWSAFSRKTGSILVDSLGSWREVVDALMDMEEGV